MKQISDEELEQQELANDFEKSLSTLYKNLVCMCNFRHSSDPYMSGEHDNEICEILDENIIFLKSIKSSLVVLNKPVVNTYIEEIENLKIEIKNSKYKLSH